MVRADFSQKNVFLDTAPLIYFIEGHSTYQNSLKKIFQANDNGDFLFITSAITLLEVLVKPFKEGKSRIAKHYKTILTESPGIEIYEITNKIAVKAAELRSKYNLRTPDALQMATAIEYGANYFFTNDTRLKSVTDISSVTLADLE